MSKTIKVLRINSKKEPETIGPYSVSYTHLDVYKRQVNNLFLIIIGLIKDFNNGQLIIMIMNRLPYSALTQGLANHLTKNS